MIPPNSTKPTMRWGNRSRFHTRGNIAALEFGSEEKQYTYGAKWLKALIGTPWRDRPNLTERGLRMSDMAVLVRTRKQMQPISAALCDAGLAVTYIGEQSLLAPPVAEAIAVALEFLGRRQNDSALNADHLAPTSKITRAEAKLAVISARLATTVDDAERGLEYLSSLIQSETWRQQSVCLIEVIEDYLAALGYCVRLPQDDGLPTPGERQLSNDYQAVENGSQAIAKILYAAADYQLFHYREPLEQKVIGFASWLRLEASDLYRGQDRAEDTALHTNSDAINLLTAHSAKGLEWPVVWIPDLAGGRFPIYRRREGSSIWDILPSLALTEDQARRADGCDTDEDRLAYVALTRSESYLLATYAPIKGARNSRPSRYLKLLKENPDVVTDKREIPKAARRGTPTLEPVLQPQKQDIQLTFSQLFLFWQCPRAFYLRHVLGFPAPIVAELGYGQSVHAAAKDMHERTQFGDCVSESEVTSIADRHFRLPFANDTLSSDLRDSAKRGLVSYCKRLTVEKSFTIISVEQEVRVDVGQVSLVGRIDLATVNDNGQVVLAEIKTENAKSDDAELIAYAIAFEATTGRLPDRVETRHIRAETIESAEAGIRSVRMDAADAENTRERIRAVGDSIRRGHYPMLPTGGDETCARCDVRRVCSRGRP